MTQHAAKLKLTDPAAAPSTGSRSALSAAIQRRDAAKEKLRLASEALERARQAAQEAEAAQARYADLDERIGKARAEMVREDRSGPLPGELIAERDQRRQARERTEEAQSALAVLAKEHEATVAALAVAERAASSAAWTTIGTEAADRLASELLAAKHQFWRLEASARALDQSIGVHAAGEVRLMLGPRMLKLFEALNAQPVPTVVGNEKDPFTQAVKGWLETHRTLLADATAELDSWC